MSPNGCDIAFPTAPYSFGHSATPLLHAAKYVTTPSSGAVGGAVHKFLYGSASQSFFLPMQAKQLLNAHDEFSGLRAEVGRPAATIRCALTECRFAPLRLFDSPVAMRRRPDGHPGTLTGGRMDCRAD